MKLEIIEGGRNYACSVVEINNLYDIESADKIQRCVINGNDIVVSKEVKKGDVMLYFVAGTQLNADYCYRNNLYDRAEYNLNKEKKGFISHRQRRIKAIKLRGIVSNGMLMPLSSLNYFITGFKAIIGTEFTHINGNELCRKYEVPVKTSNVTTKKINQAKVKDVLIDNQFRFHHETEHFAKNLGKFTEDTEIIITRKMHGSSLILSHVLVMKQLSAWEKIKKLFGVKIQDKEYGFIWSSGKPKGKKPKGIVSKSNKWHTPNSSYYTSNIWKRAFDEIGNSVEKGISLYGEIVGEGIQGKEYTYNKEYAIYIYRITYTTPEGSVIEFSWEQLKKYCEKYKLVPVQEYFKGKVKELPKDLLEYLKSTYLNKSYPDCKIDEGICVRIRDTNEIFKLKSPNFIKMESDLQEKEITNIEDAE